MKRLRLFFAVILLLLALPLWRLADWAMITSPFDLPVTLALTAVLAFCIGVPLKLLTKKIQTWHLILFLILFGVFSYSLGPLTGMASDNPDHTHCGRLSYTGFFYPIRSILSDANRDDLEARNQMCWVRKLISRVPAKFDSEHEVEVYSNLVRGKLLKPEIKYRVSLPLIAVLYFTINTSGGDFVGVKGIYDSLHFWIDHYTEEISSREYSLWNWPFSEIIKKEYGLIERNWQDLIDSIVIETH